jgi:hypothetical protein
MASGRIIAVVKLTGYTSRIAQYCDWAWTVNCPSQITSAGSPHPEPFYVTHQHYTKTQILTCLASFYMNNICAKHFSFHFADLNDICCIRSACSGTVLLAVVQLGKTCWKLVLFLLYSDVMKWGNCKSYITFF